MNDSDPILAGLRALDPQVYFEQPDTLPAPLQQDVLGIGRHDVRVGVPAEVDLAARERLPLLLIAGNTAARDEIVPAPRNTAVVSVDLDSGAVRAVTAFPPDPSKTPAPRPQRQRPGVLPTDFDQPAESPPPAKGAPPPPPPAPDSIAQTWLDARALGAVAWEPGRIGLRVLQFERVSNLAVTSLRGPTDTTPHGVPADVAAAVEREARRAEAGPDRLRRFSRNAETPHLTSPGAAFALTRELPVGFRPLPFHAAARLTLTPAQLVDPHRRRDGGAPAEIQAADLPQAVVHASVILTELDRVPPRRLDVAIPWSDTGTPQPGTEIDIAFSLDLADSLARDLAPGTYHVLLLVGEHLAGPQRLDVTPR